MSFLPSSVTLFAAITIVAVIGLPGCGKDQSTTDSATGPSGHTQESQTPQPVRLDELKFARPELRERVQLLDRLVREVGHPEATSQDWVRRPPNHEIEKELHDYTAVWSTDSESSRMMMRMGEKAYGTVRIECSVNPDEPDEIWRVTLVTMFRAKDPGWNAQMILESFRPYLKDATGEEDLSIHFSHTDGETILAPPFRDWTGTIPEEPPYPEIEGHQETRIASQGPELTMDQAHRIVASPDGLRDELLLEINTSEEQVLADIEASRGVERGRYERVDNGGRVDFRGLPLKDGEQLSAEEKLLLRGQAMTHFHDLRSHVEKDYQELHSSLLRLFPIDKYLAAEVSE